MLRFPYLLSLLLYIIELSFCYNYIDDFTDHKVNNLERNLRREKARRARTPNVRKSPILREEDYDRSPVEFDVASFIKPDEDNLETDEAFMSHRINRGTWTPKPFDLGSMLKSDDSNNRIEKTPDYMSMGDSLPELNMSPPLSKDLINAKHFGYNPLDDLNGGKYGHEKFRNIYKDDLLMNQDMVHAQEKKCSSLKTIKFPFFSHNKSEPLKPKKAKKRKRFFFNSKKQMAKIDFNTMNVDTMIPYKIKRSYEQRLCPACKKIFLANLELDRSKKNPTNVIHNSRQFYQNTLPDATLKEEIKDFKTNKISNSDERYRKKRDYDRDRQLKELEEVQRKVDAVRIRLPQFERLAENNIFSLK